MEIRVPFNDIESVNITSTNLLIVVSETLGVLDYLKQLPNGKSFTVTGINDNIITLCEV